MKTVADNPEDLSDAEKWRGWTKGEYRLICHTKYAQFVANHVKLQKIIGAIPPTPWKDPADTLIKITEILKHKT